MNFDIIPYEKKFTEKLQEDTESLLKIYRNLISYAKVYRKFTGNFCEFFTIQKIYKRMRISVENENIYKKFTGNLQEIN